MPRLASILLLCIPLCAADPHMTTDERTKAVNWLSESRREFLAAIDGVTDVQWKWKPAPDRWSVREPAGHIALAEWPQFANVQKALAAPLKPEWEEKTRNKTQTLEAVLAPRRGKAQAPEALVPGGGMTQAAVKERFLKQREIIEKFARETEA